MKILNKIYGWIICFNDWLVEITDRIERYRLGLIDKCDGKCEAGKFRDLSDAVDRCPVVVRYTTNLQKYFFSISKRVAGTNIIIDGMTSTPYVHKEIWKLEYHLSSISESYFCCFEETNILPGLDVGPDGKTLTYECEKCGMRMPVNAVHVGCGD